MSTYGKKGISCQMHVNFHLFPFIGPEFKIWFRHSYSGLLRSPTYTHTHVHMHTHFKTCNSFFSHKVWGVQFSFEKFQQLCSHTHTHTYTHTQTNTHTQTDTHIHTHTHTHTHIYTHTNQRARTHMHARTHAHEPCKARKRRARDVRHQPYTKKKNRRKQRF